MMCKINRIIDSIPQRRIARKADFKVDRKPFKFTNKWEEAATRRKLTAQQLCTVYKCWHYINSLPTTKCNHMLTRGEMVTMKTYVVDAQGVPNPWSQ
jgi:hypothetical protein